MSTPDSLCDHLVNYIKASYQLHVDDRRERGYLRDPLMGHSYGQYDPFNQTNIFAVPRIPDD